ncbi:hypothetical protein [Methylobrevis pamukkalensis]|uniref:Uncharacterized protein n=1 Tax=Methylobrevis pamukkalensis TaxID=1439726 RepID=A0A1E3H179_9HYPH|nr:hypothetical protein [Methylobrevis pamukkalensis]ODN69895.1 hypothetical protein A6302_02777 [Methylobrevis pamukkalensis]
MKREPAGRRKLGEAARLSCDGATVRLKIDPGRVVLTTDGGVDLELSRGEVLTVVEVAATLARGRVLAG